MRFRGIYVYRCYADDGGLLYVGLSDDVQRRMGEHRKSSVWFGQMARYSLVGPFAEREDAELHERHLIRTEKPAFNVQGGGAEGLRRRPMPPLEELHAAARMSRLQPGTLLAAYELRTA